MVIKDLDKNPKNNGLILGLGSIVVGALANAFMPIPYLVYSMYGIGIATIVGCYATPKDKFNILFENCGLYKGDMYPLLQERKKTSYGYCLRYSLPLGLSSDDFRKHQKAIEEYIGKKIEIKYAHKHILIEVYERLLEREYPYEPIATRKPLEVPIGRSIKRVETIDLAAAPHTLIAGETGGGKSTILRSIITYLIIHKNVILHLTDLKGGVEFNVFRKSKKVETFARNINETLKLFKKLEKEVIRRYDLFFDAEVVSIEEYNKKSKAKLNYQVAIIDEFIDLADSDCIDPLITLGSKARACGIHLIISTQRCCSKTIDTRLRANFPAVIGLKTKDVTNSRIILDQPGLENLQGKGHAILKTTDLTEIQCFNLTTEQARNIVKPTYKQEVATFEPKKDILKVLEVLDGGRTSRKTKKAR